MTKLQFLFALRDALAELPRDELEQRLHFYSEMIEDRMEEGLSEEDAVSAVGSVEEIAAQIRAELPPTKTQREKAAEKRPLKEWEIVLLVLGSPIWVSLLIAAAAVVFSLYVSIWSVIVSLWGVFGTLIGCACGGIVAGVGFVISGHYLTGAAMVGAGMVCAGVSVFLLWGCKAVTKGVSVLTKKAVSGIKNRLRKKEGAQ